MKGQFFTDRGQIRNHNEDSGGIYFNQSEQQLMIVADGMGGHKAGDVASQMATSMIQNKWEESNAFHTPEEMEAWLSETLLSMNQLIYEEAMDHEAYKGMGTTVVIAVCTEEFITIAHIGDSRCYLLNQNGFKQVTQDHSLVNALVRSGQITKDEAEHHPRKNVVLKALGTEVQVAADVQSIGWEKGNKLLLCSDGLTDKVSDLELHELIKENIDLNEIGKNMIDLANERGGEDNISLIIVCHDLIEKEGETSC